VSDSESLLWEYVRHAAEHGKATREGDYQRGNAVYGQLVETFKALVRQNARSRLLTLLKHDDQAVRCWAATHSLRVDAPSAVATLKKLSEGKGPIALDARMVLSEWEKGTLKIAGESQEAPHQS
jgi:hypothetical protein